MKFNKSSNELVLDLNSFDEHSPDCSITCERYNRKLFNEKEK